MVVGWEKVISMSFGGSYNSTQLFSLSPELRCMSGRGGEEQV